MVLKFVGGPEGYMKKNCIEVDNRQLRPGTEVHPLLSRSSLNFDIGTKYMGYYATKMSLNFSSFPTQSASKK